MSDFLAFRKMITPVIIQILFWIGVVACVIAAIINFTQGLVLGGFVVLVLGPIMVRVYCEILIVVFKVLDTLKEISANTSVCKAPGQA